jgi:hypothetical protein
MSQLGHQALGQRRSRQAAEILEQGSQLLESGRRR